VFIYNSAIQIIFSIPELMVVNPIAGFNLFLNRIRFLLL